MRHKASSLLVLFGLVAMVVAVRFLLAGDSNGRAAPALAVADSPEVVQELMLLRLLDARGVPQPVAQWRGKVLLVNFWAPWCPPCRAEMPVLDEVQRRWQARGVQVVGVTIDTPEAASAYTARNPWTFPILVAGQGGLAGLIERLGNPGQGLPFSVLIDASGHLRYIKLGPFGASELEALLARAAT